MVLGALCYVFSVDGPPM